MALAFTFIIQNEFLSRLKRKKNSSIKWPIDITASMNFSQIQEIHDYINETGGMDGSHKTQGKQQYYSMCYQHIYNPHVDKNSKYRLLENSLRNSFITKDIKDGFIQLFCKFQKMYFGFSKLAFLYKLRKSKKDVCYDMCLNELDPNSKNVLAALIDGHRYLYVLSDIVNIFKSALTHMNYMICTPMSVKNPYTNTDFSISMLYNFYFFLKSRLASVPFYIEEFYKSNFHLHMFTMLHDSYLQDFAITQYVENTPFVYLRDGMCSMLNDYNFINQEVAIHPVFPEKELFDIMKKPYLLFYYKSRYSRTHEINLHYAGILKKMLNEFFVHNPKFGSIDCILPCGEYIFNKKHISIKEVYRRISKGSNYLSENTTSIHDINTSLSLGSHRNRRAPSYTSYNSNMNLDLSTTDDSTIDADEEEEEENNSSVRV